jgi:hypothetical protein
MSVVVRRSLAVHANRTFELISRWVQSPYILFPVQVLIFLLSGLYPKHSLIICFEFVPRPNGSNTVVLHDRGNCN